MASARQSATDKKVLAGFIGYSVWRPVVLLGINVYEHRGRLSSRSDSNLSNSPSGPFGIFHPKSDLELLNSFSESLGRLLSRSDSRLPRATLDLASSYHSDGHA